MNNTRALACHLLDVAAAEGKLIPWKWEDLPLDPPCEEYVLAAIIRWTWTSGGQGLVLAVPPEDLQFLVVRLAEVPRCPLHHCRRAPWRPSNTLSTIGTASRTGKAHPGRQTGERHSRWRRR